MFKERKYEFRKFLNTVHQTELRDNSAKLKADEVCVDEKWKLVVARDAGSALTTAAADLREYLLTSMNVSVALVHTAELPADGNRHILLGTRREFSSYTDKPTVPGSYIVTVDNNGITVCGYDDRGAAHGCYHLEDLMNLRRSPFLPKGRFPREPMFSPRMVHSGWGLDQYPDQHLSAIAHAGMDAILVLTKNINTTPTGFLDFNDLINRAMKYGLDVYFYSYIKSEMHPGDDGAEAYYDQNYGRLFEACPGAKGVVLVGESCEFPSRDTVNTTGIPRHAKSDNDIRNLKPSPGWWPCHDYPEWLTMIKKVIKKHNQDADIVFWTYNWGYAPEADRIRLIESLPDGITLMATFEMFEPIKRNGITNICMDYTISFPGPGRYFAGEATAARRKGIRLYAMANTAGMTWDFGTVPYIPTPFQWDKRHKALRRAREEWGLTGLMESHHYGYYPSIVAELAKWNFWSPSPSVTDIMTKIAERDFGAAGAPHALRAWKNWSEAIRHYPITSEDQYGPCRVGPSYPMIFLPDITRTFESREIGMHPDPHAHFGDRIIKTFYHPFENEGQSPGNIRFPVEIELLEKMLAKWQTGLEAITEAIESVQENQKDAARKTLGLGQFIANTIITTINMKRWWLLNQKLLAEAEVSAMEEILRQMESIAQNEIKNAEATIPLVESNSRLGWEPSMEYMTDKAHLKRKIRQVKNILEYEIPAYRKILTV